MTSKIVFWGLSLLAMLLLFTAVENVPSGPVRALALNVGGPALLVAAPLYLVARLRFRSGAVRTTGTVERCEEDGPGEVTCVLVIGFVDLAGDRHVFTEEHAPKREVGKEVPVLYDPAAPARARLHRHPAVDLLTAAAMLLVGVVLTFAGWGPHLVR
ncbi:DUF3592 domain-containing protein [Actinomadura kijaniata]|uniref:DUF3592 domain-containing protein n=1 Tax=Actinomadura kijaniata TaxID=46161 RepID=UPI000834B02B|nr:DUF3592 domain-containing protein [Actinomadura kijaniata]